MKKIYLFLFFIFFSTDIFADFDEIKKNSEVKNSIIIFPIKDEKSIKSCTSRALAVPKYTRIEPLFEVGAPKNYGLDDRYDAIRQNFEKFSIPCGSGNKQACEKVKEVLINWSKQGAVKSLKGPSKMNDSLSINLHINNPFIAGYSFAKQVINFSDEEDEVIKGWFKKTVKKTANLMYNKRINEGKASGILNSAHNHALTSAISHMELGIVLNDHKLFRTAFKNFEHAIKSQRKDGSLPIEVRRGGRAMFYQGRAMNALAVIAIIAENQGYNIWDIDFDGKNYHNLVKFFLDFAENNEIVFRYAKEMHAPGPATNYKKQDLQINNSSNWGWLYAYASRYPDHENINRIQEWSKNISSLNTYQKGFVSNYQNIGYTPFGDASWTVVQANCHFLKTALNLDLSTIKEVTQTSYTCGNTTNPIWYCAIATRKSDPTVQFFAEDPNERTARIKATSECFKEHNDCTIIHSGKNN